MLCLTPGSSPGQALRSICVVRQAWGLWLPETVLADEGVGQNQQLAHDRGEGDLGLFAGGAQASIEGSKVVIAAAGGEGGHVEDGPHRGAAASDVAFTAAFAAVGSNGRQAGEQGGGLVRAHAEFAEADDERRRGHRNRCRGSS
jgi:hypothetical protein